jgi:class 3 adenylate cyclase/tetratricopeptide (TPR) repeat protein
VTICPNCGQDNPEGFKFCPNCAAPLVPTSASREQRKTVTVLFCDITGSTSLGESADPEALRALLARYFDRMKGIVESHGGTVEKFIGDAVMAVFGVPRVHEDDALRACRAAVEMRDALPELRVQARIGVNTGEVVSGTEERLATGDAVNVAARLEQAAQPGEILIGAETLALVHGAVETEPVEPLELKGKAEPVPAHRLLEVSGELERRHEALFVGRERELGTLLQAWRRACDETSCQLVTVVGDPGVGKSRLAAQFLAEAAARVVHGRCLSYGEGITYWPVVEVLKQLDALPSDPAAAAPLHSLLGETDEATSADEIAWAFRKLLEEQAPLVCVFDDIQWGEETFLDLIEGIVVLSSDAPIMLLCLARPELIERRPHWPAPTRLQPLPEHDVHGLIRDLPGALRERIAHAAGGNPLFVTEMVAMARETEGEVTVPATLKALLAARLDQLEMSERLVLERGAVEGETFHRGAVQAMSDNRLVTPPLTALVRKELIHSAKPLLRAEDAFRFRHLLIRDAAYDGLPKATRAELHERFAAWLEEQGTEIVELDEIAGYHLEQSVCYLAALGQPDRQLAERAGRRLAAAGRRALGRGDLGAAASLLERALELTRPIRLDVHLELDLAEALSLANPQRAVTIAEAAATRAHTVGDGPAEALCRVVSANVRLWTDAAASLDELDALARRALPLLEQAEDHAGLAYVWYALGFTVANSRCRFEEHVHASQQALHHARLAGQSRSDLFHLDAALVFGPRPADEALQALDSALRASRHPHPMLARAYLLAQLGRFEEAWAIAREQTERLRGLRGTGHEAWLAWIARLEGDEEAAARYFRAFCDFGEEHGITGILGSFAPELGRSLCALGRHEEAESLAQLGREVSNEEDLMPQMMWRRVQALVHAHRREHAHAARLAREAIAIVGPTDALNEQADTLCDLAEVLAAAGRTDEAAQALEQALERYERKKNLAMVGQVRPRLVALRTATTPAP